MNKISTNKIYSALLQIQREIDRSGANTNEIDSKFQDAFAALEELDKDKRGIQKRLNDIVNLL